MIAVLVVIALLIAVAAFGYTRFVHGTKERAILAHATQVGKAIQAHSATQLVPYEVATYGPAPATFPAADLVSGELPADVAVTNMHTPDAAQLPEREGQLTVLVSRAGQQVPIWFRQGEVGTAFSVGTSQPGGPVNPGDDGDGGDGGDVGDTGPPAAETATAALHVPAGTVTEDLPDFVTRVDLADLPPTWWDTTSPDLGNVRVRVAGHDVPVDVVWADRTERAGELYFKHTLRSAVDNPFDVVTVPDAAAPPVTGPNGRNAVWDGHEAVFMFGANENRDRTGSGRTLTLNGQTISEGLLNLNQSSATVDLGLPAGSWTVRAAFRTDATRQQAVFGVQRAAGGGGQVVVDDGTHLGLYVGGWTDPPANGIIPGRWYRASWASSASGSVVYSPTGTGQTIRAGAVDLATLRLGADSGNTEAMLGKMDRVAISGSARSEAWMAAEYLSWETPGEFYTTLPPLPANGSGETATATLTIPAGTVTEDLTGFVTRVDLSDLPSPWWASTTSNLGNVRVRANGHDIPTDIVWADRARGVGELFFKHTLRGGADNVFTIVAQAGADPVPAGDPNGRHAVWADYDAVLASDPTINRAGGATPAVFGQVARSGQPQTRGWIDTGTGKGSVSLGGLTARTSYTVAVSTYSEDADGSNKAALSYTQQGSASNSPRLTMVDDSGNTRGLWNSTDGWRRYGPVPRGTTERRVTTLNGTTEARMFLNGTLAAVDGPIAARPGVTQPVELLVGAAEQPLAEAWHGRLNYAYVRNEVLSPAWIAAEHASWHQPGTFYQLS